MAFQRGHVQTGPHIVVFKTHVDIFDKWDESIAAKLQEIAKKHGADIEVVQTQMQMCCAVMTPWLEVAWRQRDLQPCLLCVRVLGHGRLGVPQQLSV